MRRHLDGYTLATIAAMARGDATWPSTVDPTLDSPVR
jgi:hypothetical protein